MITPPGTFPSPSLGTYSPLPPTQNPDQNVLLLPSSCPLMQVPRMGVGAVSSMDPSGTQAWSLALNGWLRQKSPCRRQYPSLPGSSQEGGSLTPEGGGEENPQPDANTPEAAACQPGLLRTTPWVLHTGANTAAPQALPGS